MQLVLPDEGVDGLLVPDQHRVGHPFPDDGLGSLEDLEVVGFGKYQPPGILLGLAAEVQNQPVFTAKSFLQVPFIFFPVGNRFPGHSGSYCRPRNSRGNRGNEPGIQRFGNQVVSAKGDVLQVISLADDVRHILPGQLSQGHDSGNLHLFIDGAGPDIQGPPEYVGKSQNIVDLVGKIAPPRGHDNVITAGFCHVIGNFRIGIGQSHDDRLRRHTPDHLRGDDIPGRQPQKNIGIHHGLFQSAEVAVGDELLFDGVQIITPAVQNAPAVGHDDMGRVYPQGKIEPDAGNCRRSGSTDDHPDVSYLLPDHFQGIQKCCPRYDGRTVLIIMKNRNVEFFL